MSALGLLSPSSHCMLPSGALLYGPEMRYVLLTSSLGHGCVQCEGVARITAESPIDGASVECVPLKGVFSPYCSLTSTVYA